MEKTKCEHGAPSCSCDEYRHIACPECGKYVCAGCGSFDPRLTAPEPLKFQVCPTCKGLGLAPAPKEEPDAPNKEVAVSMSMEPTSNQDTGFKRTSGQSTDYGTGATRDMRSMKGAPVEMPYDALYLVSRIYEDGNRGRGWRNWEYGMPIADLLDSCQRHINQHIAGDRNERHLSQAGWNLLNAIQTSIWVMLGTRPAGLNNLPDHRHMWLPGDPNPCPLSQQEIDSLKFYGVFPKDYEWKPQPVGYNWRPEK